MVNEKSGHGGVDLKLVLSVAAAALPEFEEPEASYRLDKLRRYPLVHDSDDEAKATYYIYTQKGLTILGPD